MLVDPPGKLIARLARCLVAGGNAVLDELLGDRLGQFVGGGARVAVDAADRDVEIVGHGDQRRRRAIVGERLRQRLTGADQQDQPDPRRPAATRRRLDHVSAQVTSKPSRQAMPNMMRYGI
jgi:hypothetical protein